MSAPRLIPCSAAALLWCLALPNALADIYRYVDENGTTHFTNMPDHSRFTLYMKTEKEPSAVATTLGERSYPLPKANRKKYHLDVVAAAQAYALEPALIHAVISAESGYNPLARSPKGATGLMQLMPATAQRYGVENPWDPKQNIKGGAAYLRDLLKMFGNNLQLAIAAYNAGEGAVMQHGFRIPPYPETMEYVPKVLSYYRRYKKVM
ncbi:MAG TPA: lytic transglycosylase domain-containing protein [Burkholderiales bacterium]|nr:lytic transglycosylase domain-containing protein [Burkholderiales bacterium]